VLRFVALGSGCSSEKMFRVRPTQQTVWLTQVAAVVRRRRPSRRQPVRGLAAAESSRALPSHASKSLFRQPGDSGCCVEGERDPIEKVLLNWIFWTGRKAHEIAAERLTKFGGGGSKRGFMQVEC